MKKIFEKTIQMPKDSKAEVKNNFVKVTFRDKTAEKQFQSKEIEIIKDNEIIKVTSKNSKKKSIATINAITSQIKNLFSGVKNDFEYKLEVVYSHFPMNVTVKEDHVEIKNLAGAKMPIQSPIIKGTKVEVKGKDIAVKSPNKEHAGQTAANLEKATKIRGKDKRIFQDGIYIVSKPKADVETSPESEKK